MFSPGGDPTQVVRMVGQYQSSVRKSSTSMSTSTTKRTLPTRLAFDESVINESDATPEHKRSRIGSESLSSLVGRRRFPSESTGALVSVMEEKEKFKEDVQMMKRELAGSRATSAASEGRVAKLQLELDKEKLERETEKERFERVIRENKEQVENMKLKVARMKEKEVNNQEEGTRTRRLSIDKTEELERKVVKLRDEKTKLEDQLVNVKMDLSRRAEVDKLSWREQVQEYKTTVSILKEVETERDNLIEKMDKKSNEGKQNARDLEQIRSELVRTKVKTERLEMELQANQEAVLQRKAMRDKLEKFAELENENSSLKRRNQLLVETASNSGLQREQVDQLTKEVERLSEKSGDIDNLRAQLEMAQSELSEWRQLVSQWMTRDQREKIGDGFVGILAAKEVVRNWQVREVEYVDTVGSLKNEIKVKTDMVAELEEEKLEQVANFDKIRNQQTEQAVLVKRLQRKLLLVSKERDSYKGILDSYEKEITLSGQEMDKLRVEALEKNIEEYRAMVDMLEEEKGVKPTTGHNDKVIKLEHEVERLTLELERRAIKGDFNPAKEKVIHFLNNPTNQAIEKKAMEMSELAQENEALKTRLKLLEEGQTKDLTLLVGHKMEEGDDGHRVQELKEELNKAEIRKQRLMEAFKKTSHEFREVVYQLTGYRIDVLSDKYRLLPLYTDNPRHNLLFQKTNSGEIQMLESEFSLELGDLMELHLEKHNSIPMFLAGLISHLFHNQEQEQTENTEEESENITVDD